MSAALQRPAFDVRMLQILGLGNLLVTDYQINASVGDTYKCTATFLVDEKAIDELDRLLNA